MWRWMGDEKRRGPLPGVPGRDLTDDEFDAFAAKYDAKFYAGVLADCGLYAFVENGPPAAQDAQEGALQDEAGEDTGDASEA